MKGEDQARKLELKDFRFVIILFVIGVVCIVAALIFFLLPQSIECYYGIGCRPEYFSFGFITCFLGILFLLVGIKTYLRIKPQDSLFLKNFLESKRDLKVKRAEEKDDYKNLAWLRQQYYELGKTVRDIANEQGVSMITIRKWIEKLEGS